MPALLRRVRRLAAARSRCAGSKAWHFPTLAVHGGEALDPSSKASTPPLVLSTTFAVSEPLSFSANELRASDPWVYTRWANPTVRQLETKLAALEGAPSGEHCVAFGSGMAASVATMLSLLSAGDHVVVSDAQYPGVAEVCRHTLRRFGIAADFVDASEPRNVGAALRKGATKLVWIETPCNPILRLTDIAAVAALAHGAGAELAVDSTFATPCATRPLELGADFCVHSLSKYLCGHGDSIGGAVVGRSAERIGAIRAEGGMHHGGVLAPFNAYLIARGMATLPLRMRAHSENATAVARWLEAHPGVERTNFPFLESHPQHELARRQMAMASGMVSFVLKGGKAAAEQAARRMMEELELVHYAVSLGHQRSLIYLLTTEDLAERPGSSYELVGEQLATYRRWAGDGIFRMSVGLEDSRDVIQDLRRILGPSGLDH